MKLFSQAYFALPLLTTLLPRLTHAKTHIVTVGAYMFYFTPDIITADVGDYVEFQFPGESHSVVRAAYSQPCGPGVDTHSTSDGRNMSVWSGSVGGLGQFNVRLLHSLISATQLEVARGYQEEQGTDGW